MNLDRKAAPKLHNISHPEYIKPTKYSLENNIPVNAIKAGIDEMCRIDFSFNAGTWQQTKPLLASMCNSMLLEGTSKFNGKEIAEIFDFHGAYIQPSTDFHNATITIICLKKHIKTFIPIAEEIIKKSIFPEKEFKNIIARRRQKFLVEMEKVKVLCQKQFSASLFGKEHPYCQSLEISDFENIDINDLIEFYKKYYSSANCEIYLVGQHDDDTITLLNKHFGGNDWNGQHIKETIYIQKKNSIQSAIRIGKILVNRKHPDYYGLKILTCLLGGYFGSRLMANIREDKGYTYGIGANFASNKELGYFLIATEVDRNYQEATIKEIHKEIEILKCQLTPNDELTQLKQFLTGEFLRNFDGAFQQLSAFKNLYYHNLDYSHYDKYLNSISEITSERLMELANKYLDVNSMITVIVGNN